ncbi:MAG: hemerythrin domain-containing protein [Moraxellaceae bacterium]|nr:MAG: hemerythrin domain-containing protein [Moraxellaceae bacterium]
MSTHTPVLHIPRHTDSLLNSEWLFLHDELPPDDWFNADYAYKTSTWLTMHSRIQQRQRRLQQTSNAYQDNRLDWVNYKSQTLRQLSSHIDHLHGHHSIEDGQYFPRFVKNYPKLAAGFAILDNDHHRLNASLNELQHSARTLHRSELEDQQLAETLHQQLNQVGVLLYRHLSDEEDLVIPILGLS